MLPTRRPGAEHRHGGCSCPSRLQFSNVHPRATVGVKDKQEKEAVLTMFSTHFNVHPLIPDQNGTYRTAQQIHKDSAREMYSLVLKTQRAIRGCRFCFIDEMVRGDLDYDTIEFIKTMSVYY
jgi:hypothetical protein